MGLVGRWRLVEMELWDAEAMDLLGPAFIEFDEDGTGRFGFIAVEGYIDGRPRDRDGHPGVDFTCERSSAPSDPRRDDPGGRRTRSLRVIRACLDADVLLAIKSCTSC